MSSMRLQLPEPTSCWVTSICQPLKNGILLDLPDLLIHKKQSPANQSRIELQSVFDTHPRSRSTPRCVALNAQSTSQEFAIRLANKALMLLDTLTHSFGCLAACLCVQNQNDQFFVVHVSNPSCSSGTFPASHILCSVPCPLTEHR